MLGKIFCSVKQDRVTRRYSNTDPIFFFLLCRPGGYVLVPLGVLIFGWSVYSHLTVWASIIGFSVVCFGMSQGTQRNIARCYVCMVLILFYTLFRSLFCRLGLFSGCYPR